MISSETYHKARPKGCKLGGEGNGEVKNREWKVPSFDVAQK